MTDEQNDSPRPIEEQNEDGADTAILPDREVEKDTPPKPVPAEPDDDTLIAHLPDDEDPSNEETRIDLRRTPPLEPSDTDAEAASSQAWSEYAPGGGEDIAEALAAVAALGVNEASTDEPALVDPFEAVEPREERIVTRAQPVPTRAPGIAVPPVRTLKRGSMASMIPAFALIGIGAWLLFVTTTGGSFDPLLLVGISVGAIALSLLAYWISTGRWSRGALFAAALIVMTAGLFVITPMNAYPLVIAAVGVALLIGGALSRPSTRAAVAPGIVLLTAGIVGFLVTSGAISPDVLNTAAPLWFVPIVILVIIWLLPLIARMRGRD